MNWELIDRSVVYRGFFTIEHIRLRHALFAGGMSDVIGRELIQRADAVGVLPYDPVRDQVVLIEQFRIGALEAAGGPWLFEIVAGLLDPGETTEQVAHREAQEEAGLRLTELIHLHDYYPTPGSYKERVSLFLGRIDTAQAGGIYGLADEGEDIRVYVADTKTAFAMMDEGHIQSAMPLIALQWLRLHQDEVRSLWR